MYFEKIICSTTLLVMLLFCVNSYADDGIYYAGPANEKEKEIKYKFDEVIRQEVLRAVMEIAQESYRLVAQQNNINVFPVIAYQTIQHIAMYVFEQSELLEKAREAYDAGMDAIDEGMEEGLSGAVIQSKVRENIENIIRPLMEDEFYRHIVTELMKNALSEHRRIVILHAAQKQAQLQMIQRQRAAKLAVMQKMVEQQYKMAMMRRQQQYQAYKAAVEQEYKRRMQEVIQQRYMKEIARRQQIMQQQIAKQMQEQIRKQVEEQVMQYMQQQIRAQVEAQLKDKYLKTMSSLNWRE